MPLTLCEMDRPTFTMAGAASVLEDDHGTRFSLLITFEALCEMNSRHGEGIDRDPQEIYEHFATNWLSIANLKHDAGKHEPDGGIVIRSEDRA